MTNKIINHKATVYLVASIVPMMSVSIFLADLTLSILSIIFLIYLLKNNYSIFYKNIFFLISLTFYIVCIASSLLSENILFSLKSSLPFIRVVIFIFLICYLIEKNINFINVFYNFLKFTLLILILYGLGEYLYVWLSYKEEGRLLLDGDANHGIIRLSLPLSGEEKLGSYLVRLFGLFLALHLLKKNNKIGNITLYFLILLTSLVILLSGERTSLFFMLLFSFIFLILSNIDFKIKLIYFLSILIIFCSFLTFNNNLSDRVIGDKHNVMNFDPDNIIIFTAQHTAHYRSALSIFLDKPFVGQGPKMFRKLCDKKKYNIIVNFDGDERRGCASHPHNTYIQLLAETGIVGTLIFSLGFFHIIFNFIKHFLFLIFKKGKKLNNYQLIINATVLIVFWPFSPSGNFFNNWMLIMYSLPLSFYVNEYFGYKKFDKS